MPSNGARWPPLLAVLWREKHPGALPEQLVLVFEAAAEGVS
jgi:hypothetical protein